MIAYLLILFGFLMRLIPHAPNMVPIAAIALFSGAYLNKKIVPWVPLVIMIFSDMIIGLHPVVMYTWGSFILIGFMGMRLKNNRKPAAIFTTTVFASLLFFVVSNFGVWMAGTWYPKTVEGFISCYFMALPFLRNTLLSNIAFAFIIFGVYELALKYAGESRFKAVLLAS